MREAPWAKSTYWMYTVLVDARRTAWAAGSCCRSWRGADPGAATVAAHARQPGLCGCRPARARWPNACTGRLELALLGRDFGFTVGEGCAGNLRQKTTPKYARLFSLTLSRTLSGWKA